MLRNHSISNSSVLHIHLTLRTALNRAVKLKRLAVNPMLSVETPKQKKFRPSPLTLTEWRTLIQVAQKEPIMWHLMWRITIATGLRHGEVLGLSWDDFNPDTGTLYICNQLQRQTGNGLVLKSTLKADALARSIVLDEETLNLMKAWRIEQNATRLRLGSWGKLELVFTNYVDNPMEPRKAAYRWKELLTKAEMQIEGCTMPDIHLRQFFYRVESKSKLSVTIWVTQI